MFDRRCPGNGQHDGRSSQEPGQRYLDRPRTVRLRDSVKNFPGNLASSEWEPRDKSNSITLTIIHHVVPFAVGKAIAILHRGDGDNFARSLDMLLRDVGQRYQANLSFISQLGKSFYRRVEGHDGVWDVQLVNFDAVQAQSLEAAFTRFAKVRRSCIVGPLIRAGTVPASLGRNHQAGRVGKQGFGNQFLAYVRPVGICGVDEIDVEFHGTAKNRQRPLQIFGGAQMPSPVRRIAPKPRRWTEISPPSEIFPAKLAEISFFFILTSNCINSNFVSRWRSRRQPFNRHRAHSSGVEHFTLDHAPRNTYAI